MQEDEKFKYIDDLSVLEITSLMTQGLTSLNCGLHVPSAMETGNKFMPPGIIKSQTYIDNISECSNNQLMKLNSKKFKDMMINFRQNYQLNNRLECTGQLLEQVKETILSVGIKHQTYCLQSIPKYEQSSNVTSL